MYRKRGRERSVYPGVANPVYCLPRAFVSYPFYLKFLTPHYGKDIICGRVICALVTNARAHPISATFSHSSFQQYQRASKSKTESEARLERAQQILKYAAHQSTYKYW